LGVKDLQAMRKISILRSQIDGKTIESVTETDFPAVGPEDTVAHALSLMRDTGHQDIPVTDNRTYEGMVSYGTLLRKRSIKPDSKVKGVMQNIRAVTKDAHIT